MYQYLYLCRVAPKSGKDVVMHNKALQRLESLIDDSCSKSVLVSDSLITHFKKFKDDTDGYVLQVVPISSDKEITNPEIEAMPEIRKVFRDAVLIRSIEVPNFNKTISTSLFPINNNLATEMQLFS